MSAVIIGDKVWGTMEQMQSAVGVWGHGFTTSSHPVAAAAGLATLDVIEREGLPQRSAELGKYLISQVEASVAQFPFVGDVRGLGLMVGIELVNDKATKRSFDPSVGAARQLQRAAMAEGVLVRALPLNDVIALSPPLTVDKATINEIVGRLAKAMTRISGQIL